MISTTRARAGEIDGLPEVLALLARAHHLLASHRLLKLRRRGSHLAIYDRIVLNLNGPDHLSYQVLADVMYHARDLSDFGHREG